MSRHSRRGWPGRPLFLEDDVALIDLLGSLTARAVERERAMATLADAERTVIETTAIRASEARFRALLDAEPNAMLSVDEAGQVLWCTRSAERMFSAESSDLVGRPLDSLVAPANEARRPGAATSGAVRYETTGTRDDGSTFPAEVAFSSLEFDGAPATLAVVADISWRYDAEELRDRFIGVLSHELRTPITSIFGGAQVLLRRGSDLDVETRDELLTQVAGRGRAARADGREPPDPGPGRARRRGRGRQPGPPPADRPGGRGARARDVAIDGPRRGRARTPATRGRRRGVHRPDPAQPHLQRREVRRSRPPRSGSSISSEPDGSIAVRVRDDGPGIDPAESESLFSLYFRSTSSKAAPGSGIGLFVCRELVGAMGGSAWARPGPERGAEFGFALPLYVDSRTWPSPSRSASHAASDERSPLRQTQPDGPAGLVPGNHRHVLTPARIQQGPDHRRRPGPR